MVTTLRIRRPFAIKFSGTCNAFLSALRRTRKAVNYVVKPRPSFDFPRSYPSPRLASVVSPTAKIPTKHSENGWEAGNAPTLEGKDFDGESNLLNSTSADSAVGQPHLHTRSALTQSSSHISSSIYPVSVVKQLPYDYRRVISSTGRVHTLRRTKGTIHSVARRQESSLLLSQREPHHLPWSHTRSPPRQSGPKPLSPILEQGDSPDLDPGIISPNISTDSLHVNSADSAVHFVDEGSGTIFSRVQHPSGTRISTEQFALDRSSLRSSLSLHIGSPTACAATDLDAHVESLPSFMLTLPTPMFPHSPIFSPRVDFSTEKFLNAAEAAAPKDRAPTLPQCDHGQGGGRLCRDCEMQLLACRVWFQNTDGGARAALREPFVRPAQSTVRTRAVLASLGVGARSTSGVGLGLASGREDENVGVRDDGGDDMDDPSSLGIEPVPAASLRPVIVDRTSCWSKISLNQLRGRVKALSLSLSTTINKRRKRHCT